VRKPKIGLVLLAYLACNIAAAQFPPPVVPGPPHYDDKDQIISIADIKAPLKLAPLGLLAIIVPAKSADQWAVTIANNTANSLRVLSPLEFKHITDQRTYDFTEWINNPIPIGNPIMTAAELATFRKQQKISITAMRVDKKLALGNRKAFYFGALHDGEATVFLSNKAAKQPNTTLVEVSVTSESQSQGTGYSRGREIKLTDADQGKDPLPVSFGDSIVLTLPGSAFDEWEDIDEKSGLRLTRMRSGEAGHVVFSLSVTGSGTALLVIRQKTPPGKTYRFGFRFMPGIAG
jgi:hypothetical protein